MRTESLRTVGDAERFGSVKLVELHSETECPCPMFVLAGQCHGRDFVAVRKCCRDLCGIDKRNQTFDWNAGSDQHTAREMDT